MKLYFAPRTRAVRTRWMLEELGVPYELVATDPAKNEPVLVDGEVTIVEPSAICLIHLADRFPEKQFAPAVGTSERGQYYRWLSFAEGSIEPIVLAVRAQAPDPDLKRLSELFDVVDRALEGREVLVGDHFTAADLLMAASLHLANTLKLLEGHPRLFEYVLRHTKRPASRRAVSS